MKFSIIYIILFLAVSFFPAQRTGAQPATGKIIEINDQAIIVNMGKIAGLRIGTKGKIYRAFEFREEVKKIYYADIEVIDVRETESTCIIGKKLRDDEITNGLLVDFQVITKMSGENPQDLSSRAYSYYTKNDLRRALELYRRVVRINPFDANAQKMIETIEKELSTEGSETIGIKITHWFNEAKKANDAGKYKEAIDAYTNALALDPENPAIYLNRGIAHRKSGRYNMAIKDYSTSLGINPSEIGYLYRGIAYVLQENDKDATLDFNRAIKINPDYEQAYYHRGKLLMRLGKLNEAADDFRRYLQLNKDGGDAAEIRKLIKVLES